MKKIMTAVAVLLAALVLAGPAAAGKASFFGKVKTFEAGKSITITDEDGKGHSFIVSDETAISEEIKPDVVVEVVAEGKKARTIEVIHKEE